MEWNEFWDNLLQKKKLTNKVLEMNEVDEAKGNPALTEEICHEIYENYTWWKEECEKAKREIWEVFEQFEGIHLHTSRVKSMDSLIEKVIRKRYEWLLDDESKYASINGTNYRDIISDLVGLRLIINYRGRWRSLHNKIIEEFPLVEDSEYKTDSLVPHPSEGCIQVEQPKVYYAEGDDISQYKEMGLLTKKHKMDYRSIHYTVSFQHVYVEIQVRTIYDEAWSDCDHNYVYKQDDNRSHTALEQLSGILSKLTNVSNDLGELMKDIFDEQLVEENGGNGWRTSGDVLNKIDKAIVRVEETCEKMKGFRACMTCMEG